MTLFKKNFLVPIVRRLAAPLFAIFALLLGMRFYFRIDLTADRRFTIQPATCKILEKLDGDVRVEIFLDGVLPTELKYFKQSIEDVLRELNSVNRTHRILYRFVDLDEEPDDVREGYLLKLKRHGIRATSLQFKKNKRTVHKSLYPAAIISCGGRECAVLLLKSATMKGLPEMVAASMDNLEYELANALEGLTIFSRKNIAVLRSHATPSDGALSGLMKLVQRDYVLHPLYLSGGSALTKKNYDALIIVRPLAQFSEDELYLIDQYVMDGGRVLFFLDALDIDMAKIFSKKYFAKPLNTGLDSLISKYGVRIELDLVQDLQCGVYPFVVGRIGNQPQVRLLDWPFAPILTHFADHVVVKNLDTVATRFVSSIEPTTGSNAIERVPLLFTSQYTLRFRAPFYVDAKNLGKPIDKALYQDGYHIIACMLEGEFDSAYNDELLLPKIADGKKQVQKSFKTKIFVASTSSIAMNNPDPSGAIFGRWGYDPFLKKQFANKDFVSNTLRYMLSDGGAINMKRNVRLIRFLDKALVEKYRTQIQVMALALPLVFLLIAGLGYIFWYKRRYSGKFLAL